METYFSLHNHDDRSNYRLIDSINTPEGLIMRAHDLGLPGVAITNHACISSHMAAEDFLASKQEKDESYKNFKLIRGDEIYLCRNGLNQTNFKAGIDNFYHFILLAKNAKGHEQLRKLSTASHMRSFTRNKIRRVPTYYTDIEKIIGDDPGNVIGSTACIGSYIGKHILKTKNGEADLNDTLDLMSDWCRYLRDIFGEGNFFIELQPSDYEDQKYVNKHLLTLSDKLHIPAIITTDSHMLSKEDRPLHKAYLASKDGDREVDDFYASAYMMSAEEIHQFMDESNGKEVVSKCLKNTFLVGDQIENYSLHRNYHLPYIPSKEDIVLGKNKQFHFDTDEKLGDIWDKFINSDEDADRVLLHRIIDKCNSDSKFYWTKDRINRMEIELDTVWNASKKQEMCWSKYFLQVADYIEEIWKNGDSLIAPGRGSGVSFYLNYLLNIIQIDPMREKMPLFFWRF